MTRPGATLGVALSATAVRGIVLHDGSVTWHGERPIDDTCPLEGALDAVVADALSSRRGRLPVVVAVGPTSSQLRNLHRLPSVRDRRTLAAIVQQSAGRYFRQNGVPMVTTPVAGNETNDSWAGAIEEPVVRAVVNTCTRLRARSVALVPTAAVLGHAMPGGRFTWRDGDVALELCYDATALRECRCLPSSLSAAPHAADVTLDASLAALGTEAIAYAGAYAAALAGGASALALWPANDVEFGQHRAVRNAIPAAACVASLLLALVAPTLSAAHQERIALGRLRSVPATAGSLQHMEAALRDSSALLAELVAFQVKAPSTTLLLASLTQTVHPPTMLVNLRLDSDGGTLTALTPSAASLLAMLGDVPEIRGAAISGSVTPETSAPTLGMPPAPMAGVPAPAAVVPAQKLTRVTVRFHWVGERPRVASASRSER